MTPPIADFGNRFGGISALEVVEGQLPGKPKRSGRDLVNGARIEVGERLG